MKLREVSEIISGYYFRSSIADFDAGEIKLIQPNDLDNFNVDSLIKINAPATRIRRGDILLSNRSKLRAIVMPIDGHFVFPSSIYAIRLTTEKYNPEFVMTYLNSEAGQSRLYILSSGTNVLNLTKVALENFELPDISLEYQEKVTEIDQDLSKYRIATNRKADLIESIKNNLIKELR